MGGIYEVRRWDGISCIPSFVKICSVIQKLRVYSLTRLCFFTEPLPSNDKIYVYRHTNSWKEFMDYSVEIGFTQRQHGDGINLL
jgi:hypothetical protein